MHTGAQYSQPFFLLFDLVFGKQPPENLTESDASATALPLADLPLVQPPKQDTIEA